MSFVFKKDEGKKIYIADSEAQSLRLAANDLVKDIRAVCGGATLTNDYNLADIVICSNLASCFEKFSGGVKFSHEEEFFYLVQADKIVICGNGDLGTMWGIYTFSEQELGIPPYYLFDDFSPVNQEILSIEEKFCTDYPHTRFRGWFINDEDLLDGFMSKGQRNIEYAFYQNVIHPDLMEMIVETALRFRINLLIPSTLLDIENPPEENLIKIITKRGLYVSQHHIEPLGAFSHGMKRFFKSHGYDETISYISNKEAMIACWQHYAARWAKYPRVVWQLGLRGMSDKPVWQSDFAVGDSDEERGRLISEAIQTQYDIIAKASKTDKIYTTSTVWMEGAHLLSVGALSLPKDTITVFSDIGMSQMFGDDFFRVAREKSRRYGIYSHAAYWHTGPHLSEGVLPQKMWQTYETAREYQSEYYSVMNVGNLKEFTFSVNLNAKIVWAGEKASLEQIQSAYCKSYAREKADELSHGIDLYFAGLGGIDEEEYKKFCEKYNFDYHHYDALKFPVVNINDGIMYWCFHNEFNYKKDFYTKNFGKIVAVGLDKMQEANAVFERVASEVFGDRRAALHRQWCYQSFLWVKFFTAAKLLCNLIETSDTMTKDEFIAVHEKVAQCFLDILGKRREYYTDKWENWFAGDRKVSVKKLYELCLEEIRHASDYCK